jgi:hypothetical protein
MDLFRNKYFWITLLIIFTLILIFSLSLKSNSNTNPSSSKYSCINNKCVSDPNGKYDDNSCNGDCEKQKMYSCQNETCIEDANGTYKDSTCGGKNCKTDPTDCLTVTPLSPSNPGTLTTITNPISSLNTAYYNQLFGERVFIFNQDMSQSNMQQQIYDIFNQQGGFDETCDNIGQYSDYNYALLFMPGTYPPLDIPIGYYTQVLGLGTDMSLVKIDAGGGNVDNRSKDSKSPQKGIGGPNIHSSSANFSVGALNNFWRSCENMTVFNLSNYIDEKTAMKCMVWAASQAVSLRNIKVQEGQIWLFDLCLNAEPAGYASGGFIANCDCDGSINNGSQQQFIIRNSNAKGYKFPNWNQVFVGCNNNDTDAKFTSCCTNGNSTNEITVIDKTPIIYEKPYLAYDNNNYVLMMPNGLIQNSKGVNKQQDNFTKETNFTIIIASSKPDNTDRSSEIQNALSHGHVVLTPGSYTISKTIDLKGNLLIGLGLPRLKATENTTIINGNGMISGIIFIAGKNKNTNEVNNNILVNLKEGSPSYLWDVYCRCGGNFTESDTTQWSASSMIKVNGNNSILDNVWCWVADHNADNTFSTWYNASCDYGIIIGGNNVTCYGLFAEHNRINNVLWTGDNGSVYMFQSEFNYFPPDCETFKNAISYYVDDKVTKHSIYGAGAYSFFPLNQIYALAGFYFNTKLDLTFQSIFTIYLNGYGGIKNVYIDQNGHGYGDSVINPKTTDKVPTLKSYICNRDNIDNSCACLLCKNNETCDHGMCKPSDGCTYDQIIAFNNKPCNSPGNQYINPKPECGGSPDKTEIYSCKHWG